MDLPIKYSMLNTNCKSWKRKIRKLNTSSTRRKEIKYISISLIVGL